MSSAVHIKWKQIVMNSILDDAYQRQGESLRQKKSAQASASISLGNAARKEWRTSERRMRQLCRSEPIPEVENLSAYGFSESHAYCMNSEHLVCVNFANFIALQQRVSLSVFLSFFFDHRPPPDCRLTCPAEDNTIESLYVQSFSH